MRGLSLAVFLAVLLWRMPADYGIYLYIDSLEEREGVGGEGECCENMTIVESIKTRKIACDIQYTQDATFVVLDLVLQSAVMLHLSANSRLLVLRYLRALRLDVCRLCSICKSRGKV